MPNPSDPIGTVLADKYRIDGFLTQGGMGAVYRGTHLMLGRPVAIKLIKPELVTSEAVVERFLREARSASQLSHPNIVTVHDLGRTDDGTLYIAMELVDGQSLKELVQKTGPLAQDRAIALTKGICAALTLAHRQGIVHRDLKPQNVMICPTADGGEIPKLLDFGIAKTFESDEPALTATGMVLGTPQYMSPEQAQGQTVDARSDLYALGIMLYEMLGGHVPFRDTSIPALLVKHMKEPPPPLSRIRAGLPAGLENVVLRCLEKDPAARFANADEVAKALDAASGVGAAPAVSPPPPPVAETAVAAAPAPRSELRETAEVTRPTGPAQPASAPPARSSSRGPLIAVAAVVLLLVAVGGAAAIWLFRTMGSSPQESAQQSLESPSPGEDPAAVPATAAYPEEALVAEVAPSSDQTAIAAAAPSTLPAASAATQPPTTAPARPVATPAPTPPPRPASPPVAISCDGVRDACAAVVSALHDSFGKAGLPVARAGRDEIRLDIQAEEIEARSEEQFGTTFVVRTYSIVAMAEATRSGDLVPMPAPETFSFDARLGREKLNERSRVVASGITEKIQEYWSRQR